MTTLNKETLELLSKAATYLETWDIVDIPDMYINRYNRYTFDEVVKQYESDKTAYKILIEQGYKIEEIKELAQTPLQDCEVVEAIKTRKVKTILKDIKKAESKIEVLESYCDSYKKGHMEVTNKRLGIWEQTTKNKSMQNTQYAKLKGYHSELEKAYKNKGLTESQIVDDLVNNGMNIDEVVCIIEEWVF